ncbi:MAG: hypothetical protein ACRDH9_10440 [Actinomycetota bacterium]
MQTAQAAPASPAPAPENHARWLPLLGLMAVITFVTLGGFLFSGSGAETTFAPEAVEVGNPVPVAGGVTIHLAAGWEQSSSSEDPVGILLSNGTGWLLAGVPAGTGTAEELLEFYVRNYFEPHSSQLSVGSVEAFPTEAGDGVAASYVGVFDGVAVPIEGQVIAFVGPSGTGVVLDGWAAQGSYGSVRDQVETMATTVVIP